MDTRGFAARLKVTFVAGLCLVCVAGGAAASQELTDSIRRIFNTKELDGRTFGPARWIEGGAIYTTLEPSPGHESAVDIVSYETATGKRQVLVGAAQLVPPGASKPLDIADYFWSGDRRRLLIFTNTQKVWRVRSRGDYWVLDLSTKALRRLGGTGPEAALMFAKFSPDGTRAAWVRANDLYVENLTTGGVTRLTSDGSPTMVNGTMDWVYEEELKIRDGFRWSPDGTRIAFWHFDSTGVGEFSLINNTTLYPVVTRIPYPKTGTTNSAAKVGVVSAAGGPIRWMAVPGDPREHYIARMEWAGNSDELIIEHLNRLQNQNDVLFADARTGVVRQVFQDRDEAWLNYLDEIVWLKGQDRFLWLSERDGWRHVYSVSRDGRSVQLITTTPADAMAPLAADPSNPWVYFIASPDHAIERHLYRARSDGSAPPERVTPAAMHGTHAYLISPDCRWAFHTWSTFDRPPVTELVRLPSHEVVRVLEDNQELWSRAAPFLAASAEFFKVEVGDGVVLDGWMIKPRDFEASKKYPVLTYVYGEPASVSVTDAWAGKRGLFHRALANDGYLVVCFDNRGTPAPKGRAWRKVIYGAVGVIASREQSEAIRALAATRPYVDAGRMAIWGWSGGGSETLNMMFRSPGLYQVGVSVAPLTDPMLYDTIYTERYMKTPALNPDGYSAGTPLNFAEGLQGNLLIIHGSGDDNVHVQGSERLVNRLIQLGKRFDYFVYPSRSHSIDEGEGTSFDLYSRIARYVEDHVPAKAR